MMPLHQISVTPVDRAKSIEDKVMRHDTQETFHVTSPTPPSATERCSSRASTLSYSRDFCRICHCEGDSEVPLISPCYCAGSLRYVHQACLQQWIKSSDIRCCELCKFTFVMQSRTKPFGMWERLDMASSERRKLLCSVTFHVLAVTCVVWSLYVLIERTTEEVRAGVLGWPFWTKLIVVAIGVTGGIVFMYVQCKVYAQLFRRWRAYNRVIFVQNVPEKADLERPGAGSTGAPPGDRQPAHDGDQPVHVTIERPVLPPIAPAHAAAPLLPPTAPAAHSAQEEEASPPTSPAAVTSPTGVTSPVLVATLTGEEWVTPAEAVHLSAAV